MEMVEKYCQNIPQGAYHLAEKYWPGPADHDPGGQRGWSPPATTGEGDTLGVRCPNHPVTLAVIEKAGVALAAPQPTPPASPAPRPPRRCWTTLTATWRDHRRRPLCPGGWESTIVDLTGEEPAILREGAIPAQEILAVLRGEG